MQISLSSQLIKGLLVWTVLALVLVTIICSNMQISPWLHPFTPAYTAYSAMQMSPLHQLRLVTLICNLTNICKHIKYNRRLSKQYEN